jgi:hypothetical protein
MLQQKTLHNLLNSVVSNVVTHANTDMGLMKFIEDGGGVVSGCNCRAIYMPGTNPVVLDRFMYSGITKAGVKLTANVYIHISKSRITPALPAGRLESGKCVSLAAHCIGTGADCAALTLPISAVTRLYCLESLRCSSFHCCIANDVV